MADPAVETVEVVGGRGELVIMTVLSLVGMVRGCDEEQRALTVLSNGAVFF